MVFLFFFVFYFLHLIFYLFFFFFFVLIFNDDPVIFLLKAVSLTFVAYSTELFVIYLGFGFVDEKGYVNYKCLCYNNICHLYLAQCCIYCVDKKKTMTKDEMKLAEINVTAVSESKTSPTMQTTE
eukprot:16540_1